jgi:glycine/D-amino acid oxidase-like deaminating enzyme
MKKPRNLAGNGPAARKSSSEIEEYDLLILGSGAAGKLTSWSLAKQGMKTAVIERKYIGGACPNIACLPSKNIVHSAKVASYLWRSEEFGISKDNCRIDMALVRERKTFQLFSVMQTGRKEGMQTLDDAILKLVKDGLVSADEAQVYLASRDPLAAAVRQTPPPPPTPPRAEAA